MPFSSKEPYTQRRKMRFYRHIMIYGVSLLLLGGCFGSKVGEVQPEGISTKEGDIITISFVGDNILGDYYGSNGETFNWYFRKVAEIMATFLLKSSISLKMMI